MSTIQTIHFFDIIFVEQKKLVFFYYFSQFLFVYINEGRKKNDSLTSIRFYITTPPPVAVTTTNRPKKKCPENELYAKYTLNFSFHQQIYHQIANNIQVKLYLDTINMHICHFEWKICSSQSVYVGEFFSSSFSAEPLLL